MLRRIALGLVFSLSCLVGLLTLTQCDDAYDAPCQVTRREDVLVDPTIAVLPSIGLQRARDRSLAIWVRRELGDAGAPDADADAGGADGGGESRALFPELRAIDVAMVDERGALSYRTRIETPESLRTRQDSLETIGVLAEDNAAFALYWVETTTSTDPDGRLRKAAKTNVAYATGLAGGSGGIAPSLPAGTPVAANVCTQCIVNVTGVALEAESLFFVRSDRDLIDPGTLPMPSTFIALRARRDGTVTPADVPWLSIPVIPPNLEGGIVGIAGPASSRDVDAYIDGVGRIVITASGYVWLADPVTLRLIAGPIALPKLATDAHVSWTPEGEASIAWSLSPYADGRSGNDVIPREIFTGVVPAGNGVVATRERTSRGRVLLNMDRRGSDIGVAFESANRTFFAVVDSAGKKRGGGDVFLGIPGTQPVSDYGLPPLNDSTLVFALGDATFRVVTLGQGRINTTEITCRRP